jgi:hypothetical protein
MAMKRVSRKSEGAKEKMLLGWSHLQYNKTKPKTYPEIVMGSMESEVTLNPPWPIFVPMKPSGDKAISTSLTGRDREGYVGLVGLNETYQKCSSLMTKEFVS